MRSIGIFNFVIIFLLSLNVEAKTVICSYVDNPSEKHNIDIMDNEAIELSPFGQKILYRSVSFKNYAYTLKNSQGVINQTRSWVINPTRGIGKLVIIESGGDWFVYDYKCK
tara:strand:+ start:154 stop:486 length:333 start_codon:yes stop_codon:yes gene_type:complete